MSNRGHQLTMNVRFYRCRLGGFPDMKVQAPTPAAAKYSLFKLAREAGYFTRFRDFIARGPSIREMISSPALVASEPPIADLQVIDNGPELPF